MNLGKLELKEKEITQSLPERMPSTKAEKPSSRIKSAASSATCDPLATQTPTSACFKAAASFTPSPVTQTVSPADW